MSALRELARPRSVHLHVDGIAPDLVAALAAVPTDCRLTMAVNACEIVRSTHRGGVLAKRDRDALAAAMLLLDACLGTVQVPKQRDTGDIARMLAIV